MKFSQSLPLALALLEPASALVGVGWSVENVPEEGMKEITFPMNIANTTHVEGFYFANQFAFVNQDNVGYTGLQPQADKDGKSIVHAVFSSFNEGTTTSHENCHDGADGGAGVSCYVNIEGTYDHTYLLNIKNTADTTWVGTLVDSVTGAKNEIGSWTLSSGAQGIQSSQLGFIEYFVGGVDECGDLPKTQIFFGNPSSPGLSGSMGEAYEYGDCVGKSGFETHLTEDGVESQCGFEGK
ncbi:hypothetical protein N7457_005888 [Penicillium paradoxum]|uniref:uncharacterized protein n=1 Tax=Penicillium paradoxum TaxID=176176 RepID=UPI002548EEC3|nr:uncharacterized protein N7457_005888 [Penicillium paradoxum]KAJ5780728.1 hypothetical protein N7457_005888 [Penicillium paradoxum]